MEDAQASQAIKRKADEMDREEIERRLVELDAEKAELKARLLHLPPKAAGSPGSTKQKTVSDEAWLKARTAFLVEEKELSKHIAAVAAARSNLPRRAIAADYEVVTADGQVPLSSLFGQNQILIMYHLMMAPGQAKPCSTCSFFIDHFAGAMPHLSQRVSLVVAAKAPYEEMAVACACKEWNNIPLVSYGDSTLGEDMQVSWTPEQVAADDRPCVVLSLPPPFSLLSSSLSLYA